MKYQVFLLTLLIQSCTSTNQKEATVSAPETLATSTKQNNTLVESIQDSTNIKSRTLEVSIFKDTLINDLKLRFELLRSDLVSLAKKEVQDMEITSSPIDEIVLRSGDCQIIKLESGTYDSLCNTKNEEYFEKYFIESYWKEKNQILARFENWEEQNEFLVNLSNGKHYFLLPDYSISPNNDMIAGFTNPVDNPLFLNEFLLTDLTNSPTTLVKIDFGDRIITELDWLSNESLLIQAGTLNNEKYEVENKNHYIISLEYQTEITLQIPKSCQYENETVTLGIGLVEKDPINSSSHTFEFFSDSDLKKSVIKSKIYDEKSPFFCAKYHKPDYGIALVIVLDTLPNAFQILINESDTLYSKRNTSYNFVSWNQYLVGSHGIRRKIDSEILKNQPIRIDPHNSAEIVEIPNERLELLCVIEVKGDWIKIKYDCFYNQSNNPHESTPCSIYIDECKDAKTGWLRWRDRNKVFVDIFTMA